jgi:hypothetical protein
MKWGLPDAADSGRCPSSKGERMMDLEIRRRPHLHKYLMLKNTEFVLGSE